MFILAQNKHFHLFCRQFFRFVSCQSSLGRKLSRVPRLEAKGNSLKLHLEPNSIKLASWELDGFEAPPAVCEFSQKRAYLRTMFMLDLSTNKASWLRVATTNLDWEVNENAPSKSWRSSRLLSISCEPDLDSELKLALDKDENGERRTEKKKGRRKKTREAKWH